MFGQRYNSALQAQLWLRSTDILVTAQQEKRGQMSWLAADLFYSGVLLILTHAPGNSAFVHGTQMTDHMHAASESFFPSVSSITALHLQYSSKALVHVDI